MSVLDTTRSEQLAIYLNALVPGGNASNLRMDEPELLARLHNAVSAGPDVSHLTTSVTDLLAGIRNALSDEADVSAKTTRESALWTQALALLETEAGGGGEEEPSTPAWVTTLQGLSANPGDLKFAYNFASGGTGQGWDGTATLTAAQAWETPLFGPSWDTVHIIDGLGLEPNSQNIGITPAGLLPSSVFDGATLLVTGKVYSPVTVDTAGKIDFNMADNPDDTTDGALELLWENPPDDLNIFSMFNANGGAANTDTITPKVSEMRGVMSFLIDGNDLIGSTNGRPNVSGAGAIGDNQVNSVYVFNQLRTSDIPVYLTIVAVYSLQASPAARLPIMSALA